MRGGGRHRFGVPYQAVESRSWDRHRRAEAEAMDRREGAWLVVYGPWSRVFWAFAAGPVPRALVVSASRPEGLREAMREAEADGAAIGGWA